MTLADLIRKYLEDRRKACEQKARCVDLSSDNFQFYSDHNEDDDVISVSNDRFFSNNVDPKSNDQSRGNNSEKYQKFIGVSRSSRITTLPDGTLQVETVIRDSNGNEKKYVTHHKAKKEAIYHPFSRSSNQNSDSGYDYWYNKFFKFKEDKLEDESSSNITTYNPSVNMDEQTERILKEFGINGMFRPFPGSKSTGEGNSFDNGMFVEFDDSFIHEEMRKMFENFQGLDGFGQMKQGNNKKLERHMDKIFKNLTPPKAPSMFEQFAEDAYVELPEERTPLDKFVEPDEEHANKLKPVWRKSKDALKKLEKYFIDKPDVRGDIYSDIEDPKDLDIGLIFSEPKPEFSPIIHNFDDVLRRTFEPMFKSENIKTQVNFGNGRIRSKSVIKHADGNTEENTLYQIGDQKYNVKIITNRLGVEIKREKSFNFPKSDLTKFRKQWGKEFVKDLIDD